MHSHSLNFYYLVSLLFLFNLILTGCSKNEPNCVPSAAFDEKFSQGERSYKVLGPLMICRDENGNKF